MFDDLKNIPEAQKKLLKKTIGFTSFSILMVAVCLWLFKAQAMAFLGMDEMTLSIVAGVLCLIAVIDLVMIKVIFGEDEAK